MSRLRYWLLTTEYPPFHGGGIATYCAFTANLLAERNYNVTIFVADESVSQFTVKQKENIRVVRFNALEMGQPEALGYTANVSYGFASIVRKFVEEETKPDFIEAQDYLGIAYYLLQFRSLRYAFASDIPIIITLHSPAFIYLEYNRVPTYALPEFWTCEMEKQALVAADLLLAPSKFIAEEIKKYVTLDENKIRILGNPFSQSEEDESGSVVERNMIVCFGKLSRQKGSFKLLEYFDEIWQRGIRTPLHVVGGTDIVYHPEKKTMGEIVSERYQRYLENGLLILHGKVKPEMIKQYLKEAHVVVVPSIIDNLPYVILEAMSMGKVVLTSMQGGQTEIIRDGVSGFLFDHEEPGSFQKKLEFILSMNNEALSVIGQAARDSVRQQFSFLKIGTLKENILTELRTRTAIPNDRFPFVHQAESCTIEEVRSTPGLLSVVIPYFNMGAYIEDALESVFASTWYSLEVIVVNDGSTEPGAVEKLNALKARFPIRVVHHKNIGLAETRNAGARLAHGEFLAFLDADDKVESTYYEKAISVLQQKVNIFFVGAWVKYFGNSEKLWAAFTPQPPYLLIHNMVNSSGLVYKRSAFLTAGMNDKNVDYGLEDYESVVSMMAHGLNGVVLPESLFYYRVRTGSMFRQITKEKFLYAYRYMSEKHAKYYQKFGLEIMHLLNANGPGYLFDNPTRQVRVATAVIQDGAVLQRAKSFIKRHHRLKKIALMINRIKSISL